MLLVQVEVVKDVGGGVGGGCKARKEGWVSLKGNKETDLVLTALGLDSLIFLVEIGNNFSLKLLFSTFEAIQQSCSL